MKSADANVYLSGDLFPNLALPGPGGSIVDFDGQAFSGRSVVLWLTGPEPDAEVLAALDSRRAALAALEALAFVVAVGAVASNSRRHRDNTSPSTSHRKLAISINLNTGAYSGGELRFPEYGRQHYAPETGGAVEFSCSLLHEALPVTEGRRFGMFGFFMDDAGEARYREIVARERAAQGNAKPH